MKDCKHFVIQKRRCGGRKSHWIQSQKDLVFKPGFGPILEVDLVVESFVP